MKGNISINRWTGNGEPRQGVTIEVTDDSSSISFVRVNMSVEDFAQALFGSSMQDCDYTLRGVDMLGKKIVTKIINIPLKKYISEYTEAEARAILSAYLVDGWDATDGGYYDFKNHHNFSNQSVKINIHKYI